MLFFIHTTRMPSRPEICPYKTNKKNKYSKEKKIFKLMEFEPANLRSSVKKFIVSKPN